MTADPGRSNLPKRLVEVLREIPDEAFSGKLEKIYVAAANAIARLTDIDLIRYETSSTDQSSADLSLWEEMAPVIAATVMDVNTLLTVIHGMFPPKAGAGLGDLLDQATQSTEVPIGADLPTRLRTAEAILAQGRDELAATVTKLGETMRSPAVVSDRWNLLSEIQGFRSRFRERIGTLVFKTAAAFSDIQRREVVPGHAEEIRGAVVLRATVSDLERVLRARRQKVAEAEPEDVPWNAQQLEKEMDTFGKTPAYRTLRAQDKRALVELRQRLGRMMAEPPIAKDDLAQLVSGYGDLLGTIAKHFPTELLAENDREAFAATGVRLEQAQGQLEADPATAAKSFSQAVAQGQSLYGRDAKLDQFLRKQRKTPAGADQPKELAAAIDQFRELLAGLPVYD